MILNNPLLWILFGVTYAQDALELRALHMIYGPLAAATSLGTFQRNSFHPAVADINSGSLPLKVRKQSSIAATSAKILPRPDDHETVKSFAIIAANTYQEDRGRWRNLTDYGAIDEFGWEGDGLRGHIFGTADESVLVISFKGTSTIFSGGDTASMDKYMDNLMFSCCCARVDVSWTPVCGCFLGEHRCNDGCLQETLRQKNDILPPSYFDQAEAIVRLVRQRYPSSQTQLWFAGHSLGGAIAALMAVRFPGSAAITWESPGAVLYGSRLGLHGYPVGLIRWEEGGGGHQFEDPEADMSAYPIWNFGLSSDPIFMGTCKGVSSGCYYSGYAMETKCRHGLSCLFNLTDWKRNDLGTHRIDWILENVLSNPQNYPLPQCLPQPGCSECKSWKFRREQGDDEKLPPLPITESIGEERGGGFAQRLSNLLFGSTLNLIRF